LAHPAGPGRTLFQQTSVEVLADSIVFPFLWDFRMGNTVIVLLFIKNKLYWYLLPIYPAAAILTGKFFTDAFSEARINWKNTSSCVLLFCGFFLLIPNYNYNIFTLRAIDSKVSTLIPNPHLMIALLSTVGSVTIWIFIARKFPRLARESILIVLLIYSSIFAVLPLRYASHQSEIQKLTTAIAQHSQPDKRTLYFWGIPDTIFEDKDSPWNPTKIAKWYFQHHTKYAYFFFNGRQTRDMPTIRNRRKQLVSHA